MKARTVTYAVGTILTLALTVGLIAAGERLGIGKAETGVCTAYELRYVYVPATGQTFTQYGQCLTRHR